MNWSKISRYVGNALLVDALFMFIAVVIAFFDPADTSFAALFVSFLLTLLVGAFPFIFVRKTSALALQEGYVIIVLSWLLSFIFGMLPYALWGGPFTVANAWFESVSGFTTTGATILPEIESLPKGLLFWRSSTHFIGGLGVVVFLLLIIPESSPMRLRLTNMELSSLSRSEYHVRNTRTVYVFTYVYLGLVASAILLYILAGMSPFDAVNHAFSVCATGGFSTKNCSIASFGSPLISIITMMYMFLASIHFGIIFMVFVSRSLKPLNNHILKVYVGYLLVVSMIVCCVLKAQGFADTWKQALLDGSFQIMSYASTSGLATADNASWPYFVGFLMMIVGAVCGMAGSTTGGIKTDRMVILLKSIDGYIRQALHPSSVTEIKYGKANIYQKDMFPHILYVALFLVMWIVSLLLVLATGTDARSAIVATLSSLSNVGPAVGHLGTFGNYGQEPALAKFIYTLDMFMGRVEIFPVLSVFYMMIGRGRKN